MTFWARCHCMGDDQTLCLNSLLGNLSGLYQKSNNLRGYRYASAQAFPFSHDNEYCSLLSYAPYFHILRRILSENSFVRLTIKRLSLSHVLLLAVADRNLSLNFGGFNNKTRSFHVNNYYNIYIQSHWSLNHHRPI